MDRKASLLSRTVLSKKWITTVNSPTANAGGAASG